MLAMKRLTSSSSSIGCVVLSVSFGSYWIVMGIPANQTRTLIASAFLEASVASVLPVPYAQKQIMSWQQAHRGWTVCCVFVFRWILSLVKWVRESTRYDMLLVCLSLSHFGARLSTNSHSRSGEIIYLFQFVRRRF
jgi:accessory gene regulator protein AgrB